MRILRRLRNLVSRKFPRKPDTFRYRTAALYEITVPCLSGTYRSSDMRRVKLEPGMWTFWQYGYGWWSPAERIFASREEAELNLAAEGYGIGRPLGAGSNSVEWELVEL